MSHYFTNLFKLSSNILIFGHFTSASFKFSPIIFGNRSKIWHEVWITFAFHPKFDRLSSLVNRCIFLQKGSIFWMSNCCFFNPSFNQDRKYYPVLLLFFFFALLHIVIFKLSCCFLRQEFLLLRRECYQRTYSFLVC